MSENEVIIVNDKEKENHNCDEQQAKKPELSARNRKQPDRYNANNINDDELFKTAEQFHSSPEPTHPEPSKSSSQNIPESIDHQAKQQDTVPQHRTIAKVHVASMSPGERAIFQVLTELSVDILLIKQRMIDIESRNSVRNLSANNAIDTTVLYVSKRQLAELGLPIKNKENLDKFEQKLLNADFEAKVVSSEMSLLTEKTDLIYEISLLQFETLQIIGGSCGSVSERIIVPELYIQIIDAKFVQTISWTGKSNVKDVKKLRLKNYNNTVKVILDLGIAASSASRSKCQDCLIGKAIKYAYREQRKSIESDSNSTTPAPPNVVCNDTDKTDSNGNNMASTSSNNVSDNHSSQNNVNATPMQSQPWGPSINAPILNNHQSYQQYQPIQSNLLPLGTFSHQIPGLSYYIDQSGKQWTHFQKNQN